MMDVFVTLLGLWLLAGVTCSDTPSECIREEASCFLQRTPSAGSLGGNGSIIGRQNWRGRGGRRTEREECHGHIRPALISGNETFELQSSGHQEDVENLPKTSDQQHSSR